MTIKSKNPDRNKVLNQGNNHAKRFLTRKGVKSEFHLSFPSILKYEKEGKFQGYQLGERILYDRAEIEASLIKRNFQ